MPRPLRVLVLEDRKADAQLHIGELRRAGFDPNWTLADNEPAFLAGLGPGLDVILSDFSLPQIDAFAALRRLQERHLDIPFIIVSGSIGEDTAVQAIRAGADDYLLKDHLDRLGQVVSQALERKDLRDSQRKAENRLRHVLASSPAVILSLEVVGEGTRLDWISDNITGLLGYDVQDCFTPDWLPSLVHSDDLQRFLERWPLLLAEGRASGEFRCRHKKGAYRWVQEELRLVQGASNEGRECVGSWSDITELKQAAASLRYSEEKYRHLFESNPQPMWLYDIETLLIVAVNEAAVAHYGFSHQEFLALTINDLRPTEDIPTLIEPLSGAVPPLGNISVWHHRKKDGTLIDVELASHELVVDQRKMRLVLINDVTERRRAEAEREQLVAILQATPDLVAVSHLDGPASFINLAGRRLLGLATEERVSLLDFHPDWAKRLIIDEAMPVAAKEGVWTGETAFRSRSGEEIPVSQVLIAHKKASGEVAFLSVIARDIRGQRQLEAQFRQSQKMDALGQLAGGIAHDFNNLLTIISGYSDFLMLNHPRGDSDHDFLKEIRNAGERASQLTRQLLAFSRKQVVEFKVLDLNGILSDTQKMLTRLIGEDIQLDFNLSPQLKLVKADPGQIEQVLINLAVNARDAMPRGGRLTITTANTALDESYKGRYARVAPGAYVQLSVKDTGCGMSEAVRSRMFEPFFTTKEQGKGTGLGLATVFGIVKQAGGHIQVESEAGQGSCFQIYLPAAKEKTVTGRSHSGIHPSPKRGTETILLVEDDDAVREFACIALRSLGYDVVEMDRPGKAVRYCQEHGWAISLIITDVVMPEMGGREMVQRIAALVPELKVLYVSGYTDDEVVQRGVFKSEMALLQKPFTSGALGQKVREALDANKLPHAASGG